MKLNKKGQLNKLTAFALSLVVFTVVIAIGLNMVGKMRDTGRSTASFFDTNTTFTALNSTAVSFAESDQLSCSNVIILNASNKAVVTSSFTVSSCVATLTNNGINNTLVTANYTYVAYTYDASYNATATNITSMAEIPGWIPVIIVAMVGGIVLFLVIRQFGGSR